MSIICISVCICFLVESFTEAYEHAVKLAKEEGRTFIHAFNDSQVISGQGVTITYED
jgi:threonine dehydratase